MTPQNCTLADLLLIGCVKTKRSVSSKARDLYNSRLWKGRRDYAEKSGRPWYILSAKHGLLEPDAWIEPYNLALTDLIPDDRRAWSRRVLEDLKARFPVLRGMTVEIHAGGHYVKNGLENGLREAGVVVLRPLKNVSGTGTQSNWYRDRLNSV